MLERAGIINDMFDVIYKVLGGVKGGLAAATIIVLVTMDLFMMPVAKTALSAELGINASQVQSAISLFAIVYAGLCILGGKLGDMMGKKKMYVIGLSLYALAALIVALTAIGVATVFVGLAVIFPVLGYATWHSYRALVK